MVGVGVTLPKAPASGLLLYSYVFRPKHRMIINEKQRLEVLGINSNDESDAAATLTFHSPRHDALVEHFFETRIFPGIEADVDEVLSEWEAELAGSIPSPHYCKLLYEDQDQYKRQRSKYLAESRCQNLTKLLNSMSLSTTKLNVSIIVHFIACQVQESTRKVYRRRLQGRALRSIRNSDYIRSDSIRISSA